MGIRESINRHPQAAMVVVSLLALGGVVAIALEFKGDNGKPPTKNFFTIDDGKTWFVDSTSKLPPFEYRGKDAVRCYLFKGPTGKFAGLLEKYSDSTKAELANRKQQQSLGGEVPVLVKQPGEPDWQPMDAGQEAMALMKISGAENSGIERVMP